MITNIEPLDRGDQVSSELSEASSRIGSAETGTKVEGATTGCLRVDNFITAFRESFMLSAEYGSLSRMFVEA